MQKAVLECQESPALEFPSGSAGKGSGIVAAEAQVAAVVPVQSLAQERPRVEGMAKKKTKTTIHRGHFSLEAKEYCDHTALPKK